MDRTVLLRTATDFLSCWLGENGLCGKGQDDFYKEVVVFWPKLSYQIVWVVAFPLLFWFWVASIVSIGMQLFFWNHFRVWC